MKVREFELKGRKYLGCEGEISSGSNLVFIKGSNGFIMCSYLNLETAEKMNNIAAIVTGVKTIDDMLKKDISNATTNAKQIGIVPGISVLEALDKLS
ncbi:MAG: DUF1805 domain-containing protein [Endomicrobium sp.]|jgi:uncharacterized protein YunC (DUF1805 family)|nr:DUF1805 domain-containing protein [Endomicrobium sp.]MDR2399520.1 DUF1805 domain-containing protein [Endomicrobium sp.]